MKELTLVHMHPTKRINTIVNILNNMVDSYTEAKNGTKPEVIRINRADYDALIKFCLQKYKTVKGMTFKGIKLLPH